MGVSDFQLVYFYKQEDQCGCIDVMCMYSRSAFGTTCAYSQNLSVPKKHQIKKAQASPHWGVMKAALMLKLL